MNEQYSALRSNVSMLGKVLGDTIKDALGENILDRVETIRKLSKSSRAGNEANRQELLTTLQNLSNDELLPVARAFSQFLNLANTAEQYHSISPNGEAASNPEVIARTLRKLKDQPNLNEETIKQAVESLSLELVLTAHPTEITRRTLIHKMVEVNNCLKQLDNKDIADYEHHQLMRRLRQLIAQSWHTDEIRKHRPSPVDEAKWGFAVVENSLWEGVPNYLRELDVDEIKENSEQTVKDYDFARPSKFSKEHLRTLEIIFEHYGRLLTTNLPVYLRKSVQVEVMNSEAVTYSEFTNALSNPVLLGIVNFAPLHGNIIVEMASGLGYAIVDRMLGGRGDSLDKTREFSEIELLIIERILVICINLLQEPWQNVLDISPHLERIETNSQYAQIISPSEVIAIITMNIKIGDVEGLMNICLPYITLESVIDKLNTRYWYSNIQNHDETNYRNAIESLIQKSQIPVKAVLGKSLISVKDFSTLVPGDVIRLDTNVDDELDIYVGNIKKFTALPGSSGDKYAVRITSVVREEQ